MAKHRPFNAARFWSNVKKRQNGCWVWIASVDTNGYGQAHHWQAGIHGAHRISYFLATGKKPGRRKILHECDNPPCIRPSHLWPGTTLQNQRDKVKKGRAARGANHGRAKLSKRRALAILRRHDKGETGVSLARRFKIAACTVSFLVNGKTWKHLQKEHNQSVF